MAAKKVAPSDDLVKCEKCAIVIYTELALYAVCNGPCGNSYHAACIGMSRDHLHALSIGMLWMCPQCLPKFDEWKINEHKSSPVMEISQLYSEITELKSQVSLIVNSLQRPPSDDSSAANHLLRHSTPIVSSSKKGTNTTYESDTRHQMTAQCDMQSTSQTTVDGTDGSCFSLLLTNIDNTTSESDIETMVSGCLGVPVGDCLNVRKLVSKRTNCRLLDYISFKVTLNDRWKDRAMSESTWPNGIVFREFQVQHRNVWKP